MWLGYIIGIFAEDLFVLIFVAKLNFEKEATKAAERGNTVNPLLNEEEEEPIASINDINENTRKFILHKIFHYTFQFILFP